uniref:Uncharacterized protein n=1 Tax=Photinus pyralis TaxID=7054 RepID=A0A1Y1JWY8_PHOPY
MCGIFVRYSESIITRPRSSSSMPMFSRPKPCVYGRRPMATKTTSALRVSGLPPLAASTSRVTLSPDLSPLTTLVFSLKSIPCFFKSFWVDFAISVSIPGPPIWLKNSTTVTLVPSRDHTEAISRPMMPPPMTTMVSGICSRAMAPVLVMTRFSSISRPGKGVASEPVAMRMFFPRTVVSPPSLRATLISFSLTNEPAPLMYSTPFFFRRNSTPFVRPVTAVSLAFMKLARFSLTSPTSIPRFFVSCKIWWYKCELFRSDFEGMHPTLRQVPPRVPRFSIQATFMPSWPALIAATYPATPPPMITRSFSSEEEA